MKEQTLFDWDSENGIATCILTDGHHHVFYGEARCHPKDKDMMSEKTGYAIALRRAYIKALCYYRDSDCKPKLKTLKQFYNSINFSKEYDSKHYIVKRLLKHIDIAQKDLDSINELIKTEREQLKIFIDQKDEFYGKIRNNRQKESMKNVLVK